MDFEERKEYDLIFKAYQRILLHDLERVQEAVRSGDRKTASQMLSGLITDTKAALDD